MPKKLDSRATQKLRELMVEFERLDKKPTLDPLYKELNRRLGGSNSRDVVSRSAVNILRKEIGKERRNAIQPDVPWNNSPAAWDPLAYPFLLSLDRFCRTGVGPASLQNQNDSVMDSLESRELTQREAKWGVLLSGVLRSAPVEVAYDIVAAFATRETVEEVYGSPLYISDLVGLMEYKPWEDQDALETYRIACNLGLVAGHGADLVAPSQAESVELEGLRRIESIDIPSFAGITLDDLQSDLDKGLSPQARDEVQKLQHIVERSQLITRYAVGRIEELFGRSPSLPTGGTP